MSSGLKIFACCRPRFIVLSVHQGIEFLAACRDELLEGWEIDAIMTSPDNLFWRANPAAGAALRKPRIPQVVGQLVVHIVIVPVRSEHRPFSSEPVSVFCRDASSECSENGAIVTRAH
jgi:hypothetical protein